MWYEPVFGAILFGIITVIVGYAAGFIVKKLQRSAVPESCADWNKNRVMEKSLFLTGAVVWLLSFGYSKWILSKH